MLSDYALRVKLLRDLRGLVGRASFRGRSIWKEISVVHHPSIRPPGRLVEQLVDGDFAQFMDGRYVEG